MKKMMAAALICCLLPLLPARAEGIKAQVNAPARIEAYYTSKTGKSEVIVDASVIVPDVSSFYQTKVIQRHFTPADAWRLADIILPGADWVRYQAWKFDEKILYAGDPDALERLTEGVAENYELKEAELHFEYHKDAELFKGMFDPDTDPLYLNCWIRVLDHDNLTVLGKQSAWRSLRYQFNAGYNFPYYDFEGTYRFSEPTGRDIPGQALTLEQARALAQSTTARVTDDFELFMEGPVSGSISYHKRGTKAYRNVENAAEAYGFAFTRVVDGVPVTIPGSQPTSPKDERDYIASPPPGYEGIYVLVDGEYIISFCWERLLELTEKVLVKNQMLPFSQIMDIFGTVAPLTIASMETDSVAMSAGFNRLNVHEIRLGYMPMRLKNDPNTWVLCPVWDFFSIRAFAGEQYNWPGQIALTIDALDGTIIDRQFGY